MAVIWPAKQLAVEQEIGGCGDQLGAVRLAHARPAAYFLVFGQHLPRPAQRVQLGG